jgi:hypothetical protein
VLSTALLSAFARRTREAGAAGSCTFLLPLIHTGCVIFARKGIFRGEVREAQLSGAIVVRIDVRRDMWETMFGRRGDVTFRGSAEQPRICLLQYRMLN